MSEKNFFLGIDIGGTFIKLGIIDVNGKVLKRSRIESSNDINIILANIKNYLKKQESLFKIRGVGISLPGIIHQDGTMQTAGALKNLIGMNIKEMAKEFLNLPVAIITDSKAVAVAEGWLGNGSDYMDYVCVTLGSAVGGAIVINNELYQGMGGFAGEFGVSLMGRQDSDYKLDSTSLHAGVVGGLCRKYSLASGQQEMDAGHIFQLAENNDFLAQKYVQEFLDDVSRLLVNISVYLSPQAILIGGGISANDNIMSQIESYYFRLIDNYKILSKIQMPKVIPCKLANDAGMIGAVKLIIDEMDRKEME